MSESNNKEFQKFNHQLRTTSTGVKFARDLYTNPDSMDPKSITNMMRLLGMEIPKDVQISATVAQMYMSGSAIVEGYETLETVDQLKRAEQMQNLNNLSVDQARLATGFAKDQGWLDRDQASMINVGVSVAMLVASGGADIKSWVSLAMEFGSMEADAKMRATIQAAKDNIAVYQNKISTEAKELQAAANELVKGEIGVFGFLAKTSFKSSILFEQCVIKNPDLAFMQELIPGLNFVPKINVTQTQSNTESTWYGSSQSGSHVINYTQAFAWGSQEAALNGIFSLYFLPLIEPFYKFNQQAILNKKVKIEDFAKLIALDSKNFRFDSFYDIQQKFKRQLVTPWDLGLDLFSDISEAKNKEDVISGLVKVKSKEPPMDLVRLADQGGYINTVLQNTNARKKVEEVFNYAGFAIPEEVRNLANYISMLDMIDLIHNDPFYRDNIKLDKSYIERFLIFESSQRFQLELDEIFKTSMIRKTNFLARQNISTLLQTTPDKLVRINPQGINQAGIFKIK